ncbi:MAG: hypothetical protein L7S64_03830, partial [Longimicrobiales bacterium]|nr:hypothetical protein [Longimicrobiales bacterium]
VRKSGRVQFISGVPIVGSLLFLIGGRVIPVGFTPWVLLILLTEIPAMITFSSAEAPQDGAAADGPDQSASSSADPAELAEAEVDLESDASA